MQAYQLNPGGTPARLKVLRAAAAASVNNRNKSTRLQPGDWRGARHYTMRTYESAYATLSAGIGQWYSHSGPEFRNERDAHDVCRRLDNGWYTDTFCEEAALGIVSSLPHGRYIAGYRWTFNGGRVYFPEVFTDEIDAARMADEHARVFAESEREYDEQWQAAAAIEDDIATALAELADLRAEHSRMIYARQRADDPARFLEFGHLASVARETAAELCATIREKRETLATDYKGVL